MMDAVVHSRANCNGPKEQAFCCCRGGFINFVQEKENKTVSELIATSMKIGILFTGYLGSNMESTGFGSKQRQD